MREGRGVWRSCFNRQDQYQLSWGGAGVVRERGTIDNLPLSINKQMPCTSYVTVSPLYFHDLMFGNRDHYKRTKFMLAILKVCIIWIPCSRSDSTWAATFFCDSLFTKLFVSFHVYDTPFWVTWWVLKHKVYHHLIIWESTLTSLASPLPLPPPVSMDHTGIENFPFYYIPFLIISSRDKRHFYFFIATWWLMLWQVMIPGRRLSLH